MITAPTSKASASTARSTRDRFVDAGFHVSVALVGAAILGVIALTVF
jgi:hypothetical protein